MFAEQFHEELYEMTYLVVIGKDASDSKAILKRTKKFGANIALDEINRSLDMAYGTTYYVSNKRIVFLFWGNPIESVDVIVHECYHAVTGVMSYIGHKIELGHDEPAAYYMGFLFSRILDISRKAKNSEKPVKVKKVLKKKTI